MYFAKISQVLFFKSYCLWCQTEKVRRTWVSSTLCRLICKKIWLLFFYLKVSCFLERTCNIWQIVNQGRKVNLWCPSYFDMHAILKGLCRSVSTKNYNLITHLPFFLKVRKTSEENEKGIRLAIENWKINRLQQAKQVSWVESTQDVSLMQRKKEKVCDSRWFNILLFHSCFHFISLISRLSSIFIIKFLPCNSLVIVLSISFFADFFKEKEREISRRMYKKRRISTDHLIHHVIHHELMERRDLKWNAWVFSAVVWGSITTCDVSLVCDEDHPCLSDHIYSFLVVVRDGPSLAVHVFDESLFLSNLLLRDVSDLNDAIRIGFHLDPRIHLYLSQRT